MVWALPKGHEPGRFPRKHLQPGEQIVYETSPSLFAFASPISTAIVLYLAIEINFTLYVTGQPIAHLYREGGWLLYLIFVVWPVLALTVGALQASSAAYAITDRRVLAVRGIVGQEFFECSIDRIHGVAMERGSVAWVFRNGDIALLTMAVVGTKERQVVNSGGVYWKGVRHPVELRTFLASAAERLQAERRQEAIAEAVEAARLRDASSHRSPIAQSIPTLSSPRGATPAPFLATIVAASPPATSVSPSTPSHPPAQLPDPGASSPARSEPEAASPRAPSVVGPARAAPGAVLVPTAVPASRPPQERPRQGTFLRRLSKEDAGLIRASLRGGRAAVPVLGGVGCLLGILSIVFGIDLLAVIALLLAGAGAGVGLSSRRAAKQTLAAGAKGLAWVSEGTVIPSSEPKKLSFSVGGVSFLTPLRPAWLVGSRVPALIPGLEEGKPAQIRYLVVSAGAKGSTVTTDTGRSVLLLNVNGKQQTEPVFVAVKGVGS